MSNEKIQELKELKQELMYVLISEIANKSNIVSERIVLDSINYALLQQAYQQQSDMSKSGARSKRKNEI